MALTFLHNNLLQNYSYPAFDTNRLSCIRHVQPSLNSRLYLRNTKYEIPEQKRNNILSLFEDYGFTDNQISSLIIKKPAILCYGPKTLKPKLDFFNSVGFSPSDLENILTMNPYLFINSLENQIIPCYQYLKSVLRTNENVNFTIKRSTWVLKQDPQKNIAPNIELLRECGVPCDRISMLLKTQPRVMTQIPDRFAEIIKEIQKMGFDPCRHHFVAATQVLSGMKKSNWEKKKEIYRKWGWSDEEILAAFKKAPTCMATSDKKLETAMDFLVNKMGWDSSEVAACPHAIMHSLENWTVPRCLVYQFLLSKGLIKEIRLSTLIIMNKETFLKKYVEPFGAEFPELLTICEPKVVSLDLADNLLDPIPSLFQNYGFTKNQILSIITKNPVLLSHRPKTLKPKLDFFNSIGLSPLDLKNLLTLYPAVFICRLENQIIPSYQYLKSVLHTNEDVNSSIKRSTWLLKQDLQKCLAPNIEVLRECGVPSNRISTLLKAQPRKMTLNPDKFIEMIEEIKKMGFHPCRSNFVVAIKSFNAFSKSRLERKKEIYRKWGWSDEEILAAFKKVANCMATSDKKIETALDFLVNKMGWDSSQVAECPYAITHSLKYWTVPRCLVYQFLLSKGLIDKKRLSTLIHVQNEKFLEKYVEPYSAEFPELLTLFEPKVVSLDLADEPNRNQFCSS